MIDLDDVLAHAHDNCVACEGTGVVRCWSPGGPCPDGQTVCESCGPCQQSDVPALVAALREARAKVGLWEADFPCDEGCRDYPEETCSRHGRRPADLWERVEFFARERDDWRRRYEAIRDGVTGLCDEAERRADPGVRLWSMPEARIKTSDLRAVVARVEGDES